MSGHQPEVVELRYRLLGQATPPRNLLAKVPGWAGQPTPRADGSMPQPSHCVPFVEGATYGLELIYPFKTTCTVTSCEGRVRFDGSFDQESWPGIVWPPFQSTNPGHYSVASLLDIVVPEGYSLRIEPHPRFFTDTTGTVPAAVVGQIRSSWWPLFLFVTFRAPLTNERHVFCHGDPYAQVLVVPSRASYRAVAMEFAEAESRERAAQRLLRERKIAPQNRWISPDGLSFDDLYRRLRGLAERHGDGGVAAHIAAPIVSPPATAGDDE